MLHRNSGLMALDGQVFWACLWPGLERLGWRIQCTLAAAVGFCVPVD